jgi:hypothetical protein
MIAYAHGAGCHQYERAVPNTSYDVIAKTATLGTGNDVVRERPPCGYCQRYPGLEAHQNRDIWLFHSQNWFPNS